MKYEVAPNHICKMHKEETSSSLAVALAQQISMFRSRIENRSYDCGAIRILESILVSKDVDSLLQIRSSLKQFLTDQTLNLITQQQQQPLHIKLLSIDFFVRLFALIGDVQSCLTLRYEALVMREQHAATHPMLQVSSQEWLTFAQHSLHNGFYSIADKACEKASICSAGNCIADPEADVFFRDENTMKKIKKLKNAALFNISSQSVQAQASTYLKRRKIEQSTELITSSGETQSSASYQFRSGIKKRNLRRLHDYQRLS